METFQEYLQNFRPQHFAVGAPINLIINSLAMWFVANHLFDVQEKISIWRAAACALLLYLISGATIALFLIPTTVVLVFGILAWLAASLAVIRGIFNLTHQGGGGILFMYLLILITIHWIAQKALP